MNTPTHAQTTEQLETCATHPVGRALRLLGDVWTLLIVYTLLTGTKRFGELLEVMGNVSSKTLSQRLKMLEEIGFVQRQAFLEIPPRVEYHLTEKGQALGDVIRAIEQFAQKNLSGLEAPSLDAPNPASGKITIDGVAKDGIVVKARARVTVRTHLERFVGGATEETIIARVGQGIVTSIGSSKSHEEVLANPNKISRALLDRGLDAQTAFEIVSIESSRALMDLAVARKVPLGNGIITVNTDAQAWARARAGELNKGGDAARAALAMLRIKRRLTKA